MIRGSRLYHIISDQQVPCNEMARRPAIIGGNRLYQQKESAQDNEMARGPAVIGGSRLFGVNDVVRRPAVNSRSRLYVDGEMARRPAVIGRRRLYQNRRSQLLTRRWPGGQL